MKRFLILLILVFAFLPISIFSVADADLLCEKWQPGHYMNIVVRHDPQLWHIDYIFDHDLSNFKGIIFMTEWARIESEQGVYDFTYLDTVVERAEQEDKYVFFQIRDRTFFNACNGRPFVPDYVETATYENSEQAWLRGRCIAKIWEEDTMDHLIRFYIDILKRYEDNPRVLGIYLEETSIARTDGWTYEKQKQQLMRLHREVSEAVPNMLVIQNINWPSESQVDGFQTGLISSLNDINGGMGWSDTVPRHRDDWTHFELGKQNNKNIVIAPYVQTPDIDLDETQEVFDMAVRDIEGHFVMWQDWHADDSYYIKNHVIPTVNANDGLIVNTQCPFLDETDGNVPSTSGSSACYQLDIGDDLPEGFGKPDTDSGLFFKGTCDDNSIDIEIDGSKITYVYENGYYWDGNSWEGFKLNGQNVGNSLWIEGDADYTINNIDTGEQVYALSYACTWTGSDWKCGCRDQSCSQSFWNLQIYKRE